MPEVLDPSGVQGRPRLVAQTAAALRTLRGEHQTVSGRLRVHPHWGTGLLLRPLGLLGGHMLVVGIELVGDEGGPVTLCLLDSMLGARKRVLERPLVRRVFRSSYRGLGAILLGSTATALKRGSRLILLDQNWRRR